jgi:hypothetical protein
MVSTRRSQDAKTPTSVLDTFMKEVIEKPQIFFAKDKQCAAQAIAAAKNLYDTGRYRFSLLLFPYPATNLLFLQLKK